MTDSGWTDAGGTPLPPFEEIPANVSEWEAPRGSVDIGAITGEAWRVCAGSMGAVFVLGLVFALVNFGLGLTGLGSFLVGPLFAGLFFAMHRGHNLGKFEVGDLFKGFSIFLPTLLASLLIFIFYFLGICLCVVPGLIVMMMYAMTFVFIIDRRMDFWPAMEASRKLFFANFWGLTLLYVVAYLINILGACLCYVGLFFTGPMTILMITLAYRDLVGLRETGDFDVAS